MTPTLGSELGRLFPHGTRSTASAGGAAGDAEDGGIALVPIFPPDVFAAAAHLLEASGGYQYIVAPFEPRAPAGRNGVYTPPTRAPSSADVADWVQTGRRWGTNQLALPLVQSKWDELLHHGPRELVVSPRQNEEPPTWWAIAHALLVIADEACESVGYMGFNESSAERRWCNKVIAHIFDQKTLRDPIAPVDHPGDGAGHISRHVALDSISRVDRQVARVLPKGRTTDIGCNMRTLSHNLTLLPPHGRGNAYWHRPDRNNAADSSSTLNLLVVPFPFSIPDGSFVGYEAEPGPAGERWGRFDIQQKWLTSHGSSRSTKESRESFSAFVDHLIATATRLGTPINGVLLPEYALDWNTYDHLVRHLRDGRPDLEIIISGLSEDCQRRVGNTVASTVMINNANEGRRQALTSTRRKQHRWRIDAPQIAAYGLAADLDPAVLWWEHLDVGERVLHVDLFRSRSTFTAVICEDLARVEPGLSLLRALGVNLVFALLMDGPQAKGRWPGTYATALADDPGSSVLSITSTGLVDRSNANFAGKGRRIIGLWKNRPEGGAARPATGNARRDRLQEHARTRGATIELELNDGAALVVKLEAASAQEITLDGRRNDDTTAWYLADHEEIVIDAATVAMEGWDWIIGTRPPSAIVP